MLLKIVCVLGAVFLVVAARALWEGSWERIKWFGLLLGASVSTGLLILLKGWVQQVPFGVGMLLSFCCGISIALLALVMICFTIAMLFYRLERLRKVRKGR